MLKQTMPWVLFPSTSDYLSLDLITMYKVRLQFLNKFLLTVNSVSLPLHKKCIRNNE